MRLNGLEERYLKAKDKLLSDESICLQNRILFGRYFEFQERRLKRLNGLPVLDDACYKTLSVYIGRFRNVNQWFINKPLVTITECDIRRVYDGLEDGVIVRRDGKPFESKIDYYSKIFKSKLFDLAGKKELARKVIEFTKPKKSNVQFILEDDFRKIEREVVDLRKQLLLWLGWDFGENINSLLQLRKSDFYQQRHPDTDEPEYMVNFRPVILKRSRTSRSEITLYPETVQLLNQALPTLQDDELLFTFGYRNAVKFLDKAVQRSGVNCVPTGGKVTWAILRKGMACDLLNKGWTTDEVNARLGHKPSSRELDAYVSFMALGRHRSKDKVQSFKVHEMSKELDSVKQREMLQNNRNRDLQSQIQMQQDQIDELKRMIVDNLKSKIIS
jgi:hypothetical protein